jgi:hypothetical protein
MPMDHQSGNLSGLFEAEEATPGVLPATPAWFEREPNSYSDFGGAFAMTTRKPIKRDRQYTKGDVSDNNPTAGYTEDLTPLNMRRKMQGFLFADAREKPSTRPMNGAGFAITAVDNATKQYRAAAGLTAFKVGHIVLPTGFFAAGNNVVTTVTAVTATALTVSGTPVSDAAPAAVAQLEAVGFQYAVGVAALTLPQGRALLTVPAGVLTHGLNLGEWIAVVGFNNGATPMPFYGRVSNFTDTTIEFDKTTGTIAADTGVGDTVALYFGTVVRNEDDPTLIKARSYTHERVYGAGAQPNLQSTGTRGSQCNQITLTIPTPGADAKVTVEMTHISLTSFERDTTQATLSSTGTVTAALNEPCFKPGLDVYRHKCAIIDELTLNPTALVSYNTEATLVINNNLAGNKAIEVFGNSGINVGEFGVTGSLGAYWTSVAATRAVRLGAEVTWDLILTKANKAVIFDIASLGLGNGRETVEANTPVKIPLDTAAGKGKFGYTLLVSFLRYVPTALMSQQSA